MREVHDRQRSALEALYDKYAKLVFSFAMKAARDEQQSREIVQLVFTRLWTTTMIYDPDKGKFVNWLITVTRNVTIDYIRSQHRQSRLAEIAASGLGYEAETVHDRTEEAALRNIQRQRIRNACRKLNEKQTQLIDRVYWQGYTLQEIATQNNEPLGTVKSRLHQALKIMRNHLSLNEGGVRDVEF